MTNLGFIGAGNMGMAIVKGFQNSRAARGVKLKIFDIDSDKRLQLANDGYTILETEEDLVKVCKYVVLACKPQQLEELLLKIKPFLTAETVLISLCAGITADYIRRRTEKNTKVVLVMPNIPMLLGYGASALAYDEAVTQDEFAFARSVIESCGAAEVIPLDKMNEIICINASAPAFIYLFTKCFADYAAEQGINQRAALNLFSKTLIGASKMMTDSGNTIDELIGQVSSKGGTTFAGLNELHSGGFEETVRKACEACTARAYELGEGGKSPQT
jgi:pyrroline-5-carboxylate reductase